MKGKSYEITILAVGFILIAAIVTFYVIYKVRLKNTPEQHEQVVVIEKKIKWSSGGEDSSGADYIVAFEFPDGSVKKIHVSKIGIGKNRREVYDSIHEGDTGTLIYKKMKNAIEFIRFEKDHELDD